MKRLLAVLLTLALMIVSLGSVAAQAGPSQEPVDPVDGCNYYEETGHNLCGVFLDYWNDNGGLPVFGYPITEAFEEENWDTGETYLVQYFERERMEHHTALAGTEYEILLGRLGNEVLLKQGRDWLTFEKSSPSEENYFAETGFAVPQVFMDYWMSHGLDLGDVGDKGGDVYSFRESLALFGYPISQAEMETNADGDTVLTQWFERARFEHHSDNEAEFEVLLGRLGAEVLADEEPPVERPVGAQAYADLVNAEGVAVGSATFLETATGVQITVQVSGLETGTHGIHIHTVGLCEAPDFTSAGGHFNPYGAEHGFDNPNGPHAGDLPNLEVGQDGTGTFEYLNTLVTLGEGAGSLFDQDGSALVIHAGTDDQHTDPAGDSGARIACGVIEEPEPPPSEPEAVLTVITDQVLQPRHISVGADGALYVADAGIGGDDCVELELPEEGEPNGDAELAQEGEEPFRLCFGYSGSLTRIVDGVAEVIIDGLPSMLVGEDGGGLHDVEVMEDGTIYGVMGFGFGLTPEARASFGEVAELFGHLVMIEEDGTVTPVADILQYEADVNPDGGAVDTNPYAIALDGDTFLVVDAGGNALLRVTMDGEISTVAVFGSQMTPAPPFLGLPEGTEIPMESVPTDVAVGPDGNYYVTELTGFPFTVGGARVWRVDSEGSTEVFATGFTNLGAVDFDSEGNLHVMEMVSAGLLAADPENPISAAGAVIKVNEDGTRETIVGGASGLIFPTGMAFDDDDNLYVANLGVIPGASHIARLEWVVAE